VKLKLPAPRYRVVRDSWLGYEAQFQTWWCPWRQCSHDDGGWGINTSRTPERARQVCVNHLAHRTNRTGRVMAQFSARTLESNQ
jgi:hypothetical protein